MAVLARAMSSGLLRTLWYKLAKIKIRGDGKQSRIHSEELTIGEIS